MPYFSANIWLSQAQRSPQRIVDLHLRPWKICKDRHRHSQTPITWPFTRVYVLFEILCITFCMQKMANMCENRENKGVIFWSHLSIISYLFDNQDRPTGFPIIFPWLIHFDGFRTISLMMMITGTFIYKIL